MRPLPRPAVRSGVVALVAIAALAGCTTSRTACDSGGCTVELSGKQTVEVDLGSFERAVDVEVISAGAVVVASGGEVDAVPAGRDTVVGDVRVRLVELDGDDVTLRITPAA